MSVYIQNGPAKIETHPSVKEDQENFLMKAKNDPARGEVIGKLASEYHYVTTNIRVKDLVSGLTVNPEVSAVAVIDENKKPLGIIVRKKLFNMLAKPFGKEVLENKLIREVLENEHISEMLSDTHLYHRDTNILSIVNELGSSLQTIDIHRYLVYKENEVFFGIVTNIDILFYLSSISQKDLKTAKKLQNSIIKEVFSFNAKSFEVAASSNMAKEVGGDFYILDEYKPDNWVISLCDVSGKGVSAALVTAVLGGVFSMYDFNASTAIFIKKLNEYIFNSFQMEKYLTGVFMKFDEVSGKLRFYDMGHSYIFIYRNKKLYKIKTAEGNFPIGIMPEVEPKLNQVTLKPDDILVTFTDGVPEQPNAEKEEFGVKTIPEIIEKHKGKDFENVVRTVISELQNFRDKEPQHDDVTMFFMHYKGPNGVSPDSSSEEN